MKTEEIENLKKTNKELTDDNDSLYNLNKVQERKIRELRLSIIKSEQKEVRLTQLRLNLVKTSQIKTSQI